MTTPDQTKTLALLSRRGFAVISGKEDLEFYAHEIGWNMRSLMRQADLLETAVMEMKRLLHELDRSNVSAADPYRYKMCSCSPGSLQTGSNNAAASPEDIATREK